jgi:hypothetical protein
MLAAVKTYDVQLVQPDGTSGAGKYESPTGELPDVGDLIEVDQHGTRARRRVAGRQPADPRRTLRRVASRLAALPPPVPRPAQRRSRTRSAVFHAWSTRRTPLARPLTEPARIIE